MLSRGVLVKRRRYRGLSAAEEESRFSRLEVDDDEPAVPAKRAPEPPKRREVYELECRKVRVQGIPESVSRISITDEDTAAHVARELLADRVRESIVVLHLNARSQVVGFEEVARGTASGVISDPSEIFRGAIVTPTTRAIILVHNHPSGDPSPSQDDLQMTARMSEAGQIIGIPILDHIVIGEKTHFAMRRQLPSNLVQRLFPGALVVLGFLALGGFAWTALRSRRATVA